MSLSTCLMFSAGSLLSSGFHILYRIASLVWRCILGLAPLYLRELCCPLLSAMSSRSLRSSQQGLLLVLFARTATKQSRVFPVVGPSILNGLPSHLRIFIRTLSPAFFLTLRLLFLAVLESGAPLSSSLEEALYKCSIWMSEWNKRWWSKSKRLH